MFSDECLQVGWLADFATPDAFTDQHLVSSFRFGSSHSRCREHRAVHRFVHWWRCLELLFGGALKDRQELIKLFFDPLAGRLVRRSEAENCRSKDRDAYATCWMTNGW